LDPLLDLGPQHLVDFPAEPGGMTTPATPVVVVRCPRCTLVQLRDTVPADWRYTQYWYRSAVNETMVAELRDVVAQARRRTPITSKSLVLDTGANDGTLLRAWAESASNPSHMPYRIGVEPALNLYDSLKQHAEQVHQVCWPSRELRYIAERKVSVITSIAMVYGADDLGAFIREVARLLADDGVWVVQFQDLLSGMQTTAVDYLVHEHLMWFSAFSFLEALEPYGLKLLDVERRAINGGSLRCYVGRHGSPHRSVKHQIMAEAEAGLHSPPDDDTSCWPRFYRQVDLIRRAVPATIHAAVAAGQTVDLYGASTKASLLLQLCGLDARWIRWGVERQAQKVGRYIGSSGIPIVSEAQWRASAGDVALLGIYQFREAVLQREANYLAGGGQFLVPIPYPTMVRGGTRAASFEDGEGVA
jgi:NDP-4-keto-2,6-dideoxyhexose 3-C-methyltransferase